eukprot:71191-Pelagomonas_calceolata.AAC.1
MLVIQHLQAQSIFAASEGAEDACSNFLSAILDMTTAISVCPGLPVRDLKGRECSHFLKPGRMVANTA